MQHPTIESLSVNFPAVLRCRAYFERIVEHVLNEMTAYIISLRFT